MPATLPYRPGIDGLRALAVTAVVLYHADVGWLPAGFLGVDVFFVISGYLIASLLVTDAAVGTVSLAHFWRRRARRLLPALFAALAGTAAAAVLLAPDAAGRLRADLPAALGYVSNWWQIAEEQSYFDSFARPPLLGHLWSLAVEEQFYVVLPLVLVPVLRRGRTPRWAVAAAALAVAAASAVLMGLLWQPGVDPSRVYYGTDTRAAGLFVGVALALVWHPSLLRPALRSGARRLLDGLGMAAVGGVAAMMLLFDERGPVLYRGGFAAAAVLSALAVAVAAHPGSLVGKALSRPSLRWTGTRSYAIYLWHWPVIALTRPEIDVPLRGLPLLALRLVLTAILAEASWRLVEQPFRTGSAWRALRPGRLRPGVRLGLAGAVACTVLVASLSLVAVPSTPELLASAPAASTPTTLVRLVGPSPTTTTATTAPPATALVSATSVPPAPPPSPVPADAAVLAVGDSVMLAAAPALAEASGGRIAVDAAVARQVDDGLSVLQRYRDAGHFAVAAAVVVHLGTNGVFDAARFERLAQILHGVPRVVILNTRVPREWEGHTNAALAEGVSRHPSMRLVDWYSVAPLPGVVTSDWVHPTPYGAGVYAELVMEALYGP